MKHIHGNPIELWEKLGLEKLPPIKCAFSIGDQVKFTNDNGAKFDMDVIGFSKNTSLNGRFVHVVRHGSNGDGDAWWFPVRPESLSQLKPAQKAILKEANNAT